MEVSTVSPPPTSPTKGDDLCVIDVTNVAIHSVTLLTCLCGLAGNGAVLWLLRLQDRNASIFNLALTDFLFLLFAVPSALLFLVEDMSCSPILPLLYVRFLFQLSLVSCYWALLRLTGSSIKKDMKKLCKLWCHCDLPDRVLWVVRGTQYWAFFAVLLVIPTLTLLCPAHEQERCRAALISMFSVILLLFAVPVVISRTMDIIKAKCGPQQQQPERRDIVIFLVVLFALLLSLWNLLQELGYTGVSSEAVFLLACINSSIKPFIYFSVGRCRSPCSMESLQLSLHQVFEEHKDKMAHSKVTTMDTGV